MTQPGPDTARTGIASSLTSLRDLDLPTRGYRLPQDPLVEDVLDPCFAVAHRVRGLFGYFTSSVLAQVAPGLSQFLRRADVPPMQFIISPSLSDADAATIEAVGGDPRPALEDLLAEQLLRGERADRRDAVESHTLRCFAWLLAQGLLDLQVAYIAQGLFHEKTWEFADRPYAEGQPSGHAVFVTGSANATRAALRANRERMSVFPTYVPGIEQHLSPLQDSLDDYFAGRGLDALYPISDALANEWIERWRGDVEPTEGDLRRAARRVGDLWLVSDHLERVDTPTTPSADGRPHIPHWLNWHDEPYEHQEEAIVAWEPERRGILEMATGAGKTYVSLIAATRVAHTSTKPLLLVIAVPFSLLVSQWVGDCHEFGMDPITPTLDHGGRTGKFAELHGLVQNLALRRRPFGCAVVTHHMAADEEFGALIQDAADLGVTTMIVGDEVHRLGAERFVAHPPRAFDLRLGLSATPARQYDPEGTAAMEEYFGGVVYEFGLDRAIDNCLVPYDYFVLPVTLTGDEIDEFLRLSEEVAKHWRPNERIRDNTALATAIQRRRRFLDTVSGKLPALRTAIHRYADDPVRDTLIYSTARDSTQIDDVQGLLEDLEISNARITYQETPNRPLVAEILADFRNGTIGVLNAMKVLDEGFNIPEIRTAYLLSSTGTEREWTQRRGRVLRRAPGKEKATLVDFAVVPPRGTSSSRALANYVATEIRRLEAFAEHAANRDDPNGGYAMIDELLLDYFADGRRS